MIGTLVTMGLQVGSSIINMKYSKETTAKIKEMQQNFKRESQELNLRRDYEKFYRSCAFQLQIEEDGHKDRLGNIDQEFMNAIERRAYSDAISRQNYPLNISPYIIKKSVIPICGTQIYDSRKEVFCILTGSNDAYFNKEVLPVLDDMLCELISRYWNQSSMHTICYYPNTWNVNFTYTDDYIANLKVILTTPTIAITPFFEKHDGRDELILKLRMWGIGNDEGVAAQIKTEFIIDKLPMRYETTQIKDVVKQVLPHIVCAVAQNIDAYYWTSYYQPPIFPSLLSKLDLGMNNGDLLRLSESYSELYKSLALGSLSTDNKSLLLVKDVAEVNMFNFPQRIIDFLNSMSEFSIHGVNMEDLIKKTIMSLYEARTDNKTDIINHMDVRYMDNNDFKLVADIIHIAKKTDCKKVQTDLIDTINRKIRTWNS